jgi:hypothetical protein
MAELPYTDRDLIVNFKRDYEQASQRGGQGAKDARYR